MKGNGMEAAKYLRKAENRIGRVFWILSLFVLIALWASPSALALSGREIMQKVNDREDGDNQISDMEMVLIDRQGKKRSRTIRSFRSDKGKDSQSLMFFLSPADTKNTGFLTYDYDAEGKDDDQWLYLPALRKTKRIAGGDKSGSFMGSDLNFSDLSRPDLNDYNYKVMKETEVDGQKTWQIQAEPKTPDVAEESGYSKSVVWVRQDNFVMVRAVRWVHKSRRLKYFQVKELKQMDGIWVATKVQMVTKEGKTTIHGTLLNLSNVKFNQKMEEGMFSIRRLEKGL